MAVKSLEEPLYKDSRIVIRYNPQSYEDHIVEIGDSGFHMPRGILKELAETTGIENVDRKLRNVYGHGSFNSLDIVLMKYGLTTPDLALAISQARIRELEEEVRYFIRESRNYKEQLEELQEEK